MQSIEYIPGGFRIRWNESETTLWTTADLPPSVRRGTAVEIEDWMNVNLGPVVGMHVAVRVDSVTPFRFRMMVSTNPIDRTALDPHGPIGDSGGGG